MTSCYGLMEGNVALNACVAGTSAWGFLQVFLGYVLLLGVILPFVSTDGVTRDLSRRTHELLMTTPLPSWAYVWGRYLIGLLVSLGLAFLMLGSVLGMGLLLHVTVTGYPKPELGNLLTIWGSMIFPATVLVSSLSFALGTLLLRQANLAKILILLGWCLGILLLLSEDPQTTLPAWYINWDPTSAAAARSIAQNYRTSFQTIFRSLPSATSEGQFQHYLLEIENMGPAVTTWLAPHLLLAGLSLVLVALAALTFQRFRGAFSVF
jgi:ABC-type transport system involved in multi-copper enzyme maturation permease subunit